MHSVEQNISLRDFCGKLTQCHRRIENLNLLPPESFVDEPNRKTFIDNRTGRHSEVKYFVGKLWTSKHGLK